METGLTINSNVKWYSTRATSTGMFNKFSSLQKFQAPCGLYFFLHSHHKATVCCLSKLLRVIIDKLFFCNFILKLYTIEHGCARVAHCVTARWCNFSHYCRPLRQYDVWFPCSEHREALTGAPTAQSVHQQEFRVQGGSTYFATEQVGRLRYVTAVDGGLEEFPSVSWFAHPCYRVKIFQETSQ